MVNLIHLLTTYNFVSADLSLNYIDEKVNAIFTVENAVKKLTIVNPVFGFLADKLGMVHNLRFYSPYLDVTDKEIKNEHIKFIEDSSQDPLTSLVKILFPSPAGELTPSTTHSKNPLTLFKINQADSVKFFAKLFVSLLKGENNFDYTLVKPKDMKAKMFKKKERVFDEIKTKILAEPQGNYFKDKDIRLLLIHAYIITALDPGVNSDEPRTSENQNLDLFEIYLTEILNGIKSIGENDLQIIDETFLKNAIDKYNGLNFFPYSKFNQPLSNSLIPTYNRKTKTFDHTNMFPDCADVSLLHICNCLFFLNGKYNLDHLPEASADLKDFYKNNPTIFTLTKKIRNEWSKVVQDLNPEKSEVENSESPYPTTKVQYNKACGTNEVTSGIVNMMNILIRITGLERDKYLSDINVETIPRKLEKLFESLSVRDDRGIVANCVFDSQGFYEDDTKTGKKDFFGKYRLSFSCTNRSRAEMEVQHYKHHTSVHFISSIFESNVQKLKKEEIENKKNIVSEILRNYLLEDFVKDIKSDLDFFKNSFENNSKENELAIENLFFNRFYLRGKINNNEIKKRYLSDLCRLIDAKKEKTSERLDEEKMLKLITRNLPLDDYGTYKEFKNFICIRPEYIKIYKGNLIDDLIDYYSFSKLLKSKYLVSKWNETLSKEIAKIESFSICAFSYEAKKIKFFVDNIKFFSNLSKLEFSGEKLTAEMFKTIVNELIKFQNIKKIEISRPNDDFELPANFGELKSLEKIILLECNFKKNFETIGNLKNLKSLDLSDCYFDKNGVDDVFKTIVNELIKFQNIKKIEISRPNVDFELPENFGDLKSLEKINFFRCNLQKNFEIIGNLKNLKSLGLSDCYFDKNSVGDVFNAIVNELIKFQNIKKIKIWGQSFVIELPENFGELESLEELGLGNFNCEKHFETIGNLKNLKILRFENCIFEDRCLDNVVKNITFDLMKFQNIKEIIIQDRKYVRDGFRILRVK